MPSSTAPAVPGSTNDAVPTCTAAAPAMIICRASSAERMPPTPITGMVSARAAWNTCRTAIGRMAGPDRPPVTLASTGRRVRTSITMPVMVFITVTASAPARSAASA